ncbi:hypothetical protein UMM65_10735 [Aureibaculum sp. 2210JD6-5]|uniref:hypothetical protein n=1 Tax=Aureibaculum sp. 2210JD6-5 TaxID=3103957 RepID=UPI002AAD4A2E|nr:hypothetical protein [Aureibaculum sp. 2210JD6-5]MDY7395720.1 hypothetical protein [Aureibaculum sp. 2210JD6-5]
MKKYLITIVYLHIIVSCASQKIDNGSEYVLINLLVEKIIRDNKKQLESERFIYLRKETEPSNKFLSSILYKKLIDNRKNHNPGYFVDENEIVYLKKQLKEPFEIDFSKIKFPLLKEYIEPVVVKNEKGHHIQTHESLADFSKIKYNISKPFYSSDKTFAYIYMSCDNFGDMIKIFKYQNDKWRFFKNIGLSIY